MHRSIPACQSGLFSGKKKVAKLCSRLIVLQFFWDYNNDKRAVYVTQA